MKCGERVQNHGALCSKCWLNITFIDGKRCKICYASVYDTDICNECRIYPRYFEMVKSVMLYDEYSMPIIAKLKYRDNTAIAKNLASWMIKAGEEVIKMADIIVPIPLHEKRLSTRKYNQAALLANHIAKKSAKKICYDLLIRTQQEQNQVKLGRRARFKNMQSAFIINPKYSICDKKILLIDDVITTCATINNAAKILKSANVKQIFALSIARTENLRVFSTDYTIM